MEEDSKKYWRNHNKRNNYNKVSYALISLVIIFIFIGIKTNKIYFPHSNNPYVLSYNDHLYITLIEDTTKQIDNLLKSISFGSQKFKINISSNDNYKLIIENLDNISTKKTSNTIKTIQICISDQITEMKEILKNGTITYNDYLNLIDIYDTYNNSFLNIFENTLKDNKIDYTRADNVITYSYSLN